MTSKLPTKEQAPDGHWLSGAVTFDSMVILERKGLLDHLKGLTCIDTPTPLRDVLRMLEDQGEVGVQYSHHEVDLAANKINQSKAILFQLEDAGPEKKKRKTDNKGDKKAGAFHLLMNPHNV